MMASNDFILVTTCTNRKLASAKQAHINPSKIDQGGQEAITASWLKMVMAAPTFAPAHRVYGGRGFKEALGTVKKNVDKFWIISAGLGLVNATTEIPFYDLTVVNGSKNSIQSRLDQGVFNLPKWWSSLNLCLRGGVGLAQLIRSNPATLIVITLTGTYASLVADDLAQLSSAELQHVRIIGPMTAALLPPVLHPFWMPYDARFDGFGSPIPGTRSDYSQRVSRHFLDLIEKDALGESAEVHRAFVLRSLAHLSPAKTPSRTRLDDAGITEIIMRHWNAAAGSSTRMLRILRDDEKISCEQSRFARLFRSIKEEIAHEK
jgi:hypothetical protein